MTRPDATTSPTATSPSGEIPRDGWVSFFSKFSREHAQAPVIVEVLAGGERRRLADGLGLIGITANMQPGDETIDVTVDNVGKRVTHLIHKPSWVRVADEGQRAIDIESPEGTTHIVLHGPGKPTATAQRAKRAPGP